MNSQPVHVEVRSDCPLVSTESTTKRLLEVEVTADAVPLRRDRSPLNLALVIDRSGSMSGSKLKYVKQAACHLVDGLAEGDQVSVFAFDDKVMSVAPCSPITAAGRSMLKRSITAVTDGGSTNLFDGWLHGVNEVATHLLPGAVQRCLLLTDGQANQGETRQEVLEHHAHELRLRGISTSTFGVGQDFNQFLLEGMATRGGGHYYFIEHPSSIPELFRRELGEMLTVVARSGVLSVTFPEGASIHLLGDIPHEQNSHNIVAPIGDVFAGSQRLFYFEVRTPSRREGEAEFTVAINYAAQDDACVQIDSRIGFAYACGREVKSAPRDRSLRRRAAEVRVALAQTRALRLAHDGRSAEAHACLTGMVNQMRSHLTDDFASAAFELAERLSFNGVDALEMKEAHHVAYLQARTRSE